MSTSTPSSALAALAARTRAVAGSAGSGPVGSVGSTTPVDEPASDPGPLLEVIGAGRCGADKFDRGSAKQLFRRFGF